MRKLFVACLVLSLFACRNNQARTTAQVEPNVQEVTDSVKVEPNVQEVADSVKVEPNVQEVIEAVKVAENAKSETDQSVFIDIRLGASFLDLIDDGNSFAYYYHWYELGYHDANRRSKCYPIRQGWREVLYEDEDCNHFMFRDYLKMMDLRGDVKKVELWLPNNSKPSRVYKFDSRGNVSECKDYNKDGSLKLDHKYKYNLRGDLLEHSNDRYKCVYKYGKNGKLKWGKSGYCRKGYLGNYCGDFFSLQNLSLRAIFYDSNGNKIIEGAHDGGDSTPCETYCAYNSKGLLTKIVTDLGGFLAGEEDLKSLVAYCNNQLKKTGCDITYKFDSKGRIVKVLYKDSGELSMGYYPKECRYSYDARGNVVKRVVSYENDSDRTYKYKYDRAGRLIELEDGGGYGEPIKLLFKYDSRGNVIKKSYQDLASGAIKTIAEYKIFYRK